MQRNLSSNHCDAKVFHPGGDISFIRPANLPDGYPNALGVVHGEPPLSLTLYEMIKNPSKPPLPDAESRNLFPLKPSGAFPASATVQTYPLKYIRTPASRMVKFSFAANL